MLVSFFASAVTHDVRISSIENLFWNSRYTNLKLFFPLLWSLNVKCQKFWSTGHYECTILYILSSYIMLMGLRQMCLLTERVRCRCAKRTTISSATALYRYASERTLVWQILINIVHTLSNSRVIINRDVLFISRINDNSRHVTGISKIRGDNTLFSIGTVQCSKILFEKMSFIIDDYTN